MEAPRTLREKLMQDRARLYEFRDALNKAILELMNGASVVSYSLGNRSVTRSRSSLGDMRAALRDIDREIYEIEAMLSGRPVRDTSTYTYQDPQFLIPPFFF